MELDEYKKEIALLPPAAPPKTITREELSTDTVHAAVEAECKKIGAPIPQRLRAGYYRFTDQTDAYVRILRTTPLARYKDNWEELGPFMLAINASQSRSSVVPPTIVEGPREKAEREATEAAEKSRK